jgi:hypothetical protein
MAKEETKNPTTGNPEGPTPTAGNPASSTPPAENKDTAVFRTGEAIQMKIGTKMYKGTILKTDGKGPMPLVVLLTDHNTREGKQFARMASVEQIEKIK